MSWNGDGAGNGEVVFYVDGVLVESFTGYQTNQSIGGGGTLVIGNDQDTVGGGFDATQAFQGTLYDIRIFSDLRDDQEIIASYRSDLPYDEDSLIANWQFDNLSTGGVITDTVAGNNLSVRHVSAGGGFIASEPSLTFAIDENAVIGTVVGSVAGIDAQREAQVAALLATDPDLSYDAATNKFYKTVSTNQSAVAHEANAVATMLSGVSGQLVTIHSAYENELVRGLGIAMGQLVFLGANDATIEGEWRWQNGSSDGDLFWDGTGSGYPVDGRYHNWNASEPQGGSSAEDYVVLFTSDGKWRDTTNTSTFGAVIEWNADDVLDATQALTYTIQAQTVAGAFAIDSSTGQITVADGSLLDADSQAIHTITVRTTDVDTNFVDQAFTISLNNLVEDNNAPTDLSSGIELNTDGGNDAYLAAADANFLLGAEGHTYEVRFSGLTQIESGGMATFYTQRNPGASQSYLAIHDDGTLDWAGLTSSGQYTELLDGDIHSLAVSWDASAGHISFYVDGEFVESTSVASQAGSTGGTTFVLGQHVDFSTGNFDSSEAFRGTYHDFRVWDHARSAKEIGLNHQQKLTYTPAEATAEGLMANWQFEGFNGSNEVVDVVSGNNLSIGHATGTGFVASTPVEDLHISEAATGGATVGFVVPERSRC